MISKALAFGLVGAGCVAAAAVGAYVAVRQNAPAEPVAVTAPAPVAQEAPATPVADTEAVVAGKPPEMPAEAAAAEVPAPPAERPRNRRSGGPAQRVAPSSPPRAEAPVAPPAPPERVAAPVEAAAQPSPAATNVAADPARTRDAAPPAEPQFEEVVVPESSVIGLQVTTSLSSERTQVEDRVEARVTRDVLSEGRVAIPAGSRVLGSVTLVERGGKMKERARLGVRFHTLVLADGSELTLRTDGIFREGESPASESARKIGGAAVGGAILGAILGGGKGAVVGGATGAAGGTAVVMAGDRNAATLPSGTVVTVRLSAPLAVQLRKEK